MPFGRGLDTFLDFNFVAFLILILLFDKFKPRLQNEAKR